MKKERALPHKGKTTPKVKTSASTYAMRPRSAKQTERRSRQPTVQELLDVRRRLFDAVHDLSAAQLAVVLRDPIVDINVQDDKGMTALHHAAAKGARPCIRVLVASGKCNYLLPDKQGRYAFELAVEWARDYAVARLLMKKQVQQAHARGVPPYFLRT